MTTEPKKKKTGWVQEYDGTWWYGNGDIEPEHWSHLTAPPKMKHCWPARPKNGQQLKLNLR
jgi:hypothetical protein